MKNSYHIGQFVEMMDNSFNAEKADKNVEIITTQSLQLSKLMFSDYYKVEPGEEKARFKITDITQRKWKNYGDICNGTVRTYTTLTVKSSTTNKEYYIGLWSKDYAPRIMK